jgi:hypothetical protein
MSVSEERSLGKRGTRALETNKNLILFEGGAMACHLKGRGAWQITTKVQADYLV